jgi:hypothetical protein
MKSKQKCGKEGNCQWVDALGICRKAPYRKSRYERMKEMPEKKNIFSRVKRNRTGKRINRLPLPGDKSCSDLKEKSDCVGMKDYCTWVNGPRKYCRSSTSFPKNKKTKK